jgi:small subunit ribosomal protein S16
LTVLWYSNRTKIKNKIMIKIRLKKYGRKQQATYRVVIMPSATKRDGRAIEEVGFYNPLTNESNLNADRIKLRLSQGAQPTSTVKNLLRKANIAIK